MLAVVVVEMQGAIPRSGRFGGEISKVGMVWRPWERCYGPVGLNNPGDNSPASGYRVHLLRIAVVVVEMEGEEMEGEEMSHSVISIFESN